ncbi:MAG TPA: hypothetical protein VNR40_15575 [Steroidobacter sp.]|nr:hypothetical protein [Steroidobacter sp.]
MQAKTSTAKKTTTTKAPSHKAKGKSKAKASWAETMKQALEKRQGGGFPKQPKPRNSSGHPLRKNAF